MLLGLENQEEILSILHPISLVIPFIGILAKDLTKLAK
jgi:hypothetical protein